MDDVNCQLGLNSESLRDGLLSPSLGDCPVFTDVGRPILTAVDPFPEQGILGGTSGGSELSTGMHTFLLSSDCVVCPMASTPGALASLL